MPLISVIDECYSALEDIKKELVEQKKAKGKPTKTTFGEIVCMLVREHRERIPVTGDSRADENESPARPPTFTERE